jgi:hypothetical protein
MAQGPASMAGLEEKYLDILDILPGFINGLDLAHEVKGVKDNRGFFGWSYHLLRLRKL